MKRLFSLLSVLFLFAACSTYVPEFEGAVNGTVMYKDQPLEGVEVVITPGGNSFVTKSNGTFAFENLTAGSYTITFKKKGYKTVTKNVTVSAGLASQVDANLDLDGNLVTADTDILNYGKTAKVMSFNIVNQLDRLVSWEIRQDNLPAWVSFKSLSGDVPANSQNPVSVTVDRSKVKGEKDSFSLDIDVSTGNVLSVKVNIEAGKVPVIQISPIAIGYDYYQMEFIRGENCTRYCLGDDLTADIDIATIMKNGTYYDIDCGIEFNCQQYPGVTHYLYVIPFNEFDQHGEMGVYKILLDEEPAPQIQYTALKDINSAGTYNVKDAYVAYADGWRAIITDDNGHTLFYMYFDSSYTSAHPKTGDILELSGEVKLYHNMLEFTNPEFTVTGSGGFNDMIASDAIDSWNRYLIDDSSDMTSYCSLSSPGIRPVSLRGTVNKSDTGDYYYLIVPDALFVYGNIFSSDTSLLNKYHNQLVDITGYAVGSYEYQGSSYVDILVVDIEQVDDTPTLESYLGYWDVLAYNVDKEEYEEWTNMYLGTYFDEESGSEIVYFNGWFGYDFIIAYGEYDAARHQIFLRSGWGSNNKFYVNGDESKLYKSVFYPLYINEEGEPSLIGSSVKDYSAAVLTRTYNPTSGQYGMCFTNQYVDEEGMYANGFSFWYYNIDDSNDSFWDYFYKDITFTRSQNPPEEASYARSQSGRKPRNCVEIDQTDALSNFDARRFFGKVSYSL